MPKKSDDTLTRAQAIQRLIDRFKKRGTIDPVAYALLSMNERMSVVTGKPHVPYTKVGRAALKQLSKEQRDALDADLHGMSFGDVAEKHNVPVSAVAVAYSACFKKKTYIVRVR